MEECTTTTAIAWYAWVLLLAMLGLTAWGLLSFVKWLADWRIHTTNFGIQFHRGDCWQAPCVRTMEA